jgi:hypothetical protein
MMWVGAGGEFVGRDVQGVSILEWGRSAASGRTGEGTLKQNSGWKKRAPAARAGMRESRTAREHGLVVASMGHLGLTSIRAALWRTSFESTGYGRWHRSEHGPNRATKVVRSTTTYKLEEHWT